MLEKFGKAQTTEEATTIFEAFNEKIGILRKPDPPLSGKDGEFFDTFLHELGGVYYRGTFQPIIWGFGEKVFREAKGIPAEQIINPAEFFKFQGEVIQTTTRIIKDGAHKWSIFEKWKDHPEIPVSVKEVVEFVKKIPKSKGYEGAVSIEGEELLDDLIAEDPYNLYAALSQLPLNAYKYGEKGKPIRMKIEKGLNHKGEEIHYFSCTNQIKGLNSLSETEIAEILKGQGYRGESIRGKIYGTGKGFSTIVKTLIENGYPTENIIKCQDGLFTVRLPLIGVVDKKPVP